MLRVAASEAQKSQLVASLAERVAALEREAAAGRRPGRAARPASCRPRTPSSRRCARARTRTARARSEKLQLLTEAKAALSDQFKTLANEILEEKSKRFAEQNQQNLGTLLDPLRTQLSEFKGKVEEVYVKEGKERSALTEQVRQLMELNQTLSNDANNLTKALKGSAKTQGNWGELILERVLEASGLRKGHEYHVQESQRDEDGRRAARRRDPPAGGSQAGGRRQGVAGGLRPLRVGRRPTTSARPARAPAPRLGARAHQGAVGQALPGSCTA